MNTATLDVTLPDFTAGLRRSLLFSQLMRDCPQFFYADVCIHSVYGCFPGCVWNGGRAFVREPYTREQVEATFAALDEQGLSARLTFTNMLLEERHLEDPYALMILDAAAEYGAGVIVHSDLLDTFVRARHPHMERTLSTTRALADVDELNGMLARFDMVVLDYNRNKDQVFLDGVASPGRLEVMLNELCMPRCPHRQEHYRHNSADQLEGVVHEFRGCRFGARDIEREAPTSPTILSNADARMLHERYGVSRFKLVGRGVGEELNLESYLYYLVRPEHRAGLRRALAAPLGLA